MKTMLFYVLVILLTPLYIFIKICERILEYSIEITSPCAEGIQIFVENMTEFWKKLFKFKEEK